MLAALAARHDVVERQVTRDSSAVLARVAVPGEHLGARQSPFVLGTPHALRQADDGRNSKRGGDAVDHAAAVLNQLGFAAEHQHDGAASAAHIVGLEALIEDENRSIYHTGALGLF